MARSRPHLLRDVVVRAAERVDRVQVPKSLIGPSRRLAGMVRALPGGTTTLPGARLGHPTHPFLVTGPIGAWTSAAALDALGSAPRTARRLVGAGVLLAIPTALTGLDDWLDTEGAEQSVGALHALCNAGATVIYAGSWAARRRHPRVGVALGGAGATLATVGGWLGGHMVYSMGVGVDTTAFSHVPSEWAPLEGEPPVTGEATLSTLQGARVACTRADGDALAVADRCTHRGGPLSEGEISDGCFTCPWHGSRFDARTGRVRTGPASIGQPTYELRDDGGGHLSGRRTERRSLRTNPV